MMYLSKKSTSLVAMLALSLVLSACSSDAKTPAPVNEAETETSTTPATSEETQPAESNTINNETEEKNDGSAVSKPVTTAERPANKTFELMMEGELQKYEATLQQGDGYSVYVFDEYTLDAQQNELFLSNHPTYKATIEPLSNNAESNLDELRKEGISELTAYGKANEYSGDQLFEGPMVGASLYLQVSSSEGTYGYIVWKPENENGYIFRTYAPEGEPAGNFGLKALTSLATIQAD